MATNQVQQGQHWTWRNGTGVAVSAGSIIVIGAQIGNALVDIPAGESGAVQMRGIISAPKATGNAIAQGEKVLWDVSAGKFDVGTATPAPGDISGCCVAALSADSAATTVQVQLNVGIGTVH